jgi:hypothetical protein
MTSSRRVAPRAPNATPGARIPRGLSDLEYNVACALAAGDHIEVEGVVIRSGRTVTSCRLDLGGRPERRHGFAAGRHLFDRFTYGDSRSAGSYGESLDLPERQRLEDGHATARPESMSSRVSGSALSSTAAKVSTRCSSPVAVLA